MDSKRSHSTRQSRIIKRDNTRFEIDSKGYQKDSTVTKQNRAEIFPPENGKGNRQTMSLGVSILLLNHSNSSVFKGLDKRLESLKRKKTFEAKRVEMEWLYNILGESTHLLQCVGNLFGKVIPDVEGFRKLVEMKERNLSSQNALLELQIRNLQHEINTVEQRRLEVLRLKSEMGKNGGGKPQIVAREQFVEMRVKINADRDIFLKEFQQLLRADEMHFEGFQKLLSQKCMSLGEKVEEFWKCENHLNGKLKSLCEQKKAEMKSWEELWRGSVNKAAISKGLGKSDSRVKLKSYSSKMGQEPKSSSRRRIWTDEMYRLFTEKNLEAEVQANRLNGIYSEIGELSAILGTMEKASDECSCPKPDLAHT